MIKKKEETNQSKKKPQMRTQRNKEKKQRETKKKKKEKHTHKGTRLGSCTPKCRGETQEPVMGRVVPGNKFRASTVLGEIVDSDCTEWRDSGVRVRWVRGNLLMSLESG